MPHSHVTEKTWTATQMADELGRSYVTICRYLQVLDLVPLRYGNKGLRYYSDADFATLRDYTLYLIQPPARDARTSTGAAS